MISDTQKRYSQTEKGKATRDRYNQSEKRKAAQKRYSQTEKGKAVCVRHMKTEKGKITAKKASKRYSQTDKCKARVVLYQQTEDYKRAAAIWRNSEAGKASMARRSACSKAKRKRNLGYKPINNKFPGSDGHHINKELVIFIPNDVHKSIKHKQDDLISMKAINDVAFEWLCNQEIL